MKHRILLIEPTIQPVGEKMLRDACDVAMAPDGSEETLIRCINEHQAEAVVTRVEMITEKILSSCPGLRFVAQHGVGLDNIDVAAASAHNIKVLNVPDANYTSVAEHAIMFILASARNLLNNDRQVRAGNWLYRNSNPPSDIGGKTLLIVALGRIGKDVAKKAKAMGMDVIAYDGYVSAEEMEKLGVRKADDLNEGLKKADFVTIHAPLTEETRHMFSDAQFEVMKETAYLCNMGRGPVVDADALYRALKDHRIAGAALDVFEPEPPDQEDALLKLDNLIVTPHNAGDTYEAKQRCSEKLAANLIRALDGEETYNWVNRPKK